MMETINEIAKEKLYYEIIVRDKNGKVISRQKDEAHSFLVQYNELLAACFAGVGVTIKDTGGTDRTIDAEYTSFNLNAAIGVVLRGIRVGTGSTAVAVGDYALETAIAEGTGAGQLSYQAQTYPINVTVSDPDCTFELKRIIENHSNGTIVVTEIGIYVRCRGDPSATSYYLCIARDVLGSSVSVPVGGTITVIYTWKITE